MQSLYGNFSIHRTKTVDGRDAILVVPVAVSELPMGFTWDDEKSQPAEVHFANVQGGSFPPDQYLTLLFDDDYRVELAPYAPPIGTT